MLSPRRMTVLHHVLVATDFGKPAERAEALAADIAERFGAALTVLFVLSIPNMAYAAGYLRIDEMERQARKTLDAKAAKLRERFPALESMMRTGIAWEEILAASQETGVDLIVMGTHGRTGLPRALLGSVAEKVLRMAPVPVLTVPTSEHERKS